MSYIYVISSTVRPESGVLYVGSTSGTVQARLKQHLYNAARGAETPLAQWIRQQPAGTVVATEVDALPGGGAWMGELHSLETQWIRFFRESGKVLLNRGLPLKTRVGTGLPPVPLTPPCELPAGFVI